MKLTTKIVLQISLFFVVLFFIFGYLTIHERANDIKEAMMREGKIITTTMGYSSVELLLSENYPEIDTNVEYMLKEFPDIVGIELYYDKLKIIDIMPQKNNLYYKRFTAPIKEETLGNIGNIVVYLKDNTNKQ